MRLIDRFAFLSKGLGAKVGGNIERELFYGTKQTSTKASKDCSLNRLGMVVIVLCNDAEIEVDDGEACLICGCELEEYDEVTGTGVFGYYHWACVPVAD
jgi:hypothetical protein